MGSGAQRPPERQPARPIPSGGHLHTEDLAVALGVDPHRDQGVHVDHPPAFADLEYQGISGHERVWAGI